MSENLLVRRLQQDVKVGTDIPAPVSGIELIDNGDGSATSALGVCGHCKVKLADMSTPDEVTYSAYTSLQ